MRSVHTSLFTAINLFLFARYPRLVRKFKKRIGYYPNIAAPEKFHEMIFWRKIFDRNPLFITFCDKLAAKVFIKTRIPEAEIPETLWIGKDFASIPRQLRCMDVVLKANHGSGFNHFGVLDEAGSGELQAMTRKWLRTNYSRDKGEWAYSRVPRTLFLERRLPNTEPEKLVDVSVRCSNGKAILASADEDNKTPVNRSGFFGVDGKRCTHFETMDPEDIKLPEDYCLPASFSKAVEYAKRLSVGVDYARYDFLCLGTKIYPGEITVYPFAGLTPSYDTIIDTFLTDNWDVSTSWFLRQSWRGWRKAYACALRDHFATLGRLAKYCEGLQHTEPATPDLAAGMQWPPGARPRRKET